MSSGGGGAPQLPFQPEAPRVQTKVDTMQTTGEGLLDPASDYAKRLRAQMSRELGGQAEARKRAAALTAAESGFGAGMSPELLAAQGQIDVAGLEATGEAQANLALEAPRLASTFLNPALGGQEQIHQTQAQSYLTQQQIAAQQAQQEMQAELERRRIEAEAINRQLALLAETSSYAPPNRSWGGPGPIADPFMGGYGGGMMVG